MEEKIVRFDDGTEVKVIRKGNRFYLEEMKKEKQSNRHVMSEHSMYMHNVVIREDTDSASYTLKETEEE